MSAIMFVINVSLAVADLVLSIMFSELGRNSDDRSEKMRYISFSIIYAIMMIYFTIQATLI